MQRRPSASILPPVAAREEARRALEWRRAGHRGGTKVGLARARDLANGRNLSPSTIKRMASFFARHEVDARAEGFRPGERGYPSPGRVAWGLWGGDAGRRWAQQHIAQEQDMRRNPDDETEEDYESEDLGAGYYVDEGDHIFLPRMWRGTFNLALSDALDLIIRHDMSRVQIVHGTEVDGFDVVADIVRDDLYRGSLPPSHHEPEAVVVVRNRDLAIDLANPYRHWSARFEHMPTIEEVWYGPPRGRTMLRDSSWVAFVPAEQSERARAHDEDLVENPPWTTAIVAKYLETLEAEAPPQWLPKLSRVSAQRDKLRASVREYGCGSYGCVFPTHDPAIVLKITTDASEADFAENIVDQLPAKITVSYPMVMAVPEKKKGYPIFLLWRDSAERAGEIDKWTAEHGGDPEVVEEAIDAQHDAAKKAWKLIIADEDATAAMQVWVEACERMGRKVPALAQLAHDMVEVWRETGIFISDVHAGNLGLVGDRWLIIDPGNVVSWQPPA